MLLLQGNDCVSNCEKMKSQAFEASCLRKLLRISYLELTTNDCVRGEIKLFCWPSGTPSGKCQEMETCMVWAFHATWKPFQNHPSRYLGQAGPATTWDIGGTRGMIQQKSSSSLHEGWFSGSPPPVYMRDDSAEVLLQSFLQKAIWTVLALTGMSTLWCHPSSIFCAHAGTARDDLLQKRLEEDFCWKFPPPPKCPDWWKDQPDLTCPDWPPCIILLVFVCILCMGLFQRNFMFSNLPQLCMCGRNTFLPTLLMWYGGVLYYAEHTSAVPGVFLCRST